MKQAILLTLALWAGFWLAAMTIDMRLAAAIGFAATLLIAAVNSVTFLWLWHVRATPLALGMAVSWAGQAALSALWCFTGMPDAGRWLDWAGPIFLFLSMYIVGGGLHIAVIQNSTGSMRTAAIWPVIALAAVALGVHLAS